MYTVHFMAALLKGFAEKGFFLFGQHRSTYENIRQSHSRGISYCKYCTYPVREHVCFTLFQIQEYRRGHKKREKGDTEMM